MVKCDKCKGLIKDIEPCVNYSETINKPKKTLIEKHWHQKCWIKSYNDSMDIKIKAYTKQIMENAKPMLQELQNRRGMLA